MPIFGQVSVLAKKFPNGKVKTQTACHLIWEMDITPSPNSRSYRIRIDYTLGSPPKIFVIKPTQLKKAEGASSLPHVFDDEKQQLCLYYGRIGEWDSSMFLAMKIVPWAAEWLFFYELWLIIGEWLGGGVGHSRKKPFVKSE